MTKKKLAPCNARLTPRFGVAAQLLDNNIGYAHGDAITRNRNRATYFLDEKRAIALRDKWRSRSDVKAAWVFCNSKMMVPQDIKGE